MYKISVNGEIIRLSDLAIIPKHEGNTDYRRYLTWLKEGNTPEYEQLEDLIVIADREQDAILAHPENRVLFKALLKLENRVRVLEGKPLLTEADYTALAKASYLEEVPNG